MQLIIMGVEMEFLSAGFFTAVGLFLAFTGLVWLPTVWVAMLLLTPKTLVQKYFKEPHFSKAELGLLSVFPGTLGRTGIFMGACFQERYRKNRKLEGYLEHVPKWYVRGSIIFSFCSLIFLLSIFLLAIGLTINLWLNDKV